MEKAGVRYRVLGVRENPMEPQSGIRTPVEFRRFFRNAGTAASTGLPKPEMNADGRRCGRENERKEKMAEQGTGTPSLRSGQAGVRDQVADRDRTARQQHSTRGRG